MKTRGLATPKQNSDYIYDDISKPESTSSLLRPLVRCPSCPKSFNLLRSLYGHFGSSHAKNGGTKLNQDMILYGCPYCKVEEVEFTTLDGVLAHVVGLHDGCELYVEKPSATRQESFAAALQSEPSDEGEDTTNQPTPTNRLASHPLGRCPCCPKILAIRGIFGHFGRVHSGIKFDWGKVSYLCPFCDSEGTENATAIYATFDETRAHVDAEHEGCVLVPIGPSRTGSQNETDTPEKEVVAAVRSSQRKRTSVSSFDETSTTFSKKSTPQALYQCPSCERTFNKQGLATHYGMVHSKTLNWEKVKIAEFEGRAYICPECERNFSKAGLHTHFGMMHDGKLDWDRVKIVDGGDGFSVKRKRDVFEANDTEEEEEEEEDEGPVRKSRRISARASRSAEDDESEFVNFAAAAAANSEQPALNFGPWTAEEHQAFLLGQRNHGNEWKRISAEYVPTRTPKQIGSHALAYFTTKGQWEGRKGPSKSGDDGQRSYEMDKRDTKPMPPVISARVKMTYDTKSVKKKKSVAADGSMDESQIKRSAWSAEEHAAFIEGHKQLGNSWLLISQKYVPSRTPKQVGSHALHHFTAIGKWDEAKKSKRDPSLYEGLYDIQDTPSNEEMDDGNFDYCIVCEDGGELICCSDCPRSYHRSCISNNSSTLPLNWSCERCRTDSVVLSQEELPLTVSSADIQSTYSNFMYSEGFEYCCDLLKRLSLIVSKLKESDHGYIFAEPVDLSVVPHYTDKVSVPMDYGTISNKIDTGAYAALLEPLMKRPMDAIILRVIHDIELVHKNCSSFNPKGSCVYRAGTSQSKKWSAYFHKYISTQLPQTAAKAYKSNMLDAEKVAEGQVPRHQTTPKKSKRGIGLVSPSSGVILTKEQFDCLENIYFSQATDLTESICASDENTRVTISQWFERLEDLRKHKVLYGSAVVTISQDDKLYQWIIRQRKRFHLTLHHKPEFQSERYINFRSSNDNDEDITWLMKSPAMTGTFALSPPRTKKKVPLASPASNENDIKERAADLKAAKFIKEMHQQTLYYPTNSNPPYRHSSSLFWDECLEELRFFRGEHKHTVVPRSFPYNANLSLWVDIQRAKVSLRLVGYHSGILGAQMHVLDDELSVCNLNFSPLAAASTISNHNSPVKEDDADDFDDANDDLNLAGHDNPESTQDEPPPPVQSIDVPVVSSPVEVNTTPSPSNADITVINKKKEYRAAMCKCTACDKSFHSLRKLYGHFGSAHARIMGMKMNTNDVLFGCPWCQDGQFKPLKDIETHVKDCHPNCEIQKSEYTTAAGVAGKANCPKTKASPTVIKTLPKKVSLFKKHLSEFIAWYQQHPSPSRETMSKELYVWCWKQCNLASALLLGSPNVGNVKSTMNATKMQLLATNGFFRAFSYTDKTMVYEDDYEGSEEWEMSFNSLQAFSITQGTTIVPEYFHYIGADTRAWISDVHDELRAFTKGEHCELSIQQIEQLILIGFCIDRSDLPNLTRSDVVWLKRFRELKQYQLVIGDCHVTEDYPQLHQWLNEQKKLFRLFRMGNEAMMKVERIRLLMDAGVDFFTADYFPYLTGDDLVKFEKQISTPPDMFRGRDVAFIDAEEKDDDFPARFEGMKAMNGHSLILADENLDVYQWFISMRSAVLDSYAASFDTEQESSLSSHLVLTYFKDKENSALDQKTFKTKESMVLWNKYCERYMMFLAVKGHGHIPQDYPDIALLQWLSKQQDEIYTHCSKHPNGELPMHLKVLVSLGVKGKKRDVQPTFSSRILRRKGPIKSKTKRV